MRRLKHQNPRELLFWGRRLREGACANTRRPPPRAGYISLRRNWPHRYSIPGEQFTNLMRRSAPANVRHPYASRKLRSLGTL